MLPHGYSESFVQVFTSIYYAFTFLGSVAAGWLTARLANAGWTVFASRIFVFGLCASLTALSVPAAFLPAGWPMLGCLLLVAFGSLGLFPVYYSFTQELSAAHQGKVGGSLGFLVWMVMAYIHELVGKAVDADPSVRPYILAAVGIAPLVGCLALGTLWGRRTVTERVVFEA